MMIRPDKPHASGLAARDAAVRWGGGRFMGGTTGAQPWEKQMVVSGPSGCSLEAA